MMNKIVKYIAKILFYLIMVYSLNVVSYIFNQQPVSIGESVILIYFWEGTYTKLFGVNS